MPFSNIKMNIWLKIAVDVVLLSLVALPVLLFFLLGQPFERGFFCDDDSIRYPYKDSTVTSGALYAVGTLVPIIFIALIEYFDVRQNGRSSVQQEKIRMWMFSLYHFVGVFLFGCAVSHFTVDICKYSVGRLRPHFITVCDPDWSKIDCSLPGNYINEDVCTPSNQAEKDLIKEARLSFISGHASFSTYTMVFLILYLQYRFRFEASPLLRPVVQFILFGGAVFTCLSRISDYKHHPMDVLAGFVNGFAYALLVFFWLAKSRLDKYKSSTTTPIEAAQMHNLNNKGLDINEIS